MWPTLKQPWYFLMPFDVATDHDGYVYVADTHNHRIRKFTGDGHFITEWGSKGHANGQFDYPYGIATDIRGHVYVIDTFNNRIQKFDTHGSRLAAWGGSGVNAGDFNNPYGISVDEQGYLFVADTGNHRVQMFTVDGQFIRMWGQKGDGPNQFEQPKGILAKDGYVYITDTGNHRIQKFDIDGQLIEIWGGQGTEDGHFDLPTGIAADNDGFLYVADNFNDRVQKLTIQGDFVTKWGIEGNDSGEFVSPSGLAVSDGFVFVADWNNRRIQKFSTDGRFYEKWAAAGAEPGKFVRPGKIALDNSGFIYVADTNNHRIQKFNADGHLEILWGSEGNGDGELDTPYDVAAHNGFVYVADTFNDRIQVFDSNGGYISQWGTEGSMPGQLNDPAGIDIDDAGNVYVADWENHRIQKFDSTGNPLKEWGGFGDQDAQFKSPSSLVVSQNNVYVVDSDNHRIQKFDQEGEYIAKWGTFGSGIGQFNYPAGITADSVGNIYVAEAGNHRFQKFGQDGTPLSSYGTFGSNPGQFKSPEGIAVSIDNTTIFIVDSENNRIQKLRIVLTSQVPNKAIIIAGGGPYPGNKLWDATQSCTNFAYRTLTYQGFDKDIIYYLSEDTDLDLDGNGSPDDVDEVPTVTNTAWAVTEWAKDAGDLLVYLADHGGKGAFRLNGSETLSATQLDNWLDTVQASISGRVIVVYDACKSGSFLENLTPPDGKERIVLTGASNTEDASFINKGAVSFSNYFWNPVFNGKNVAEAFASAQAGIGEATRFQHPQMDADNSGTGNDGPSDIPAQSVYIGNGTPLGGNAPLISAVSPSRILTGTNTAEIFAEVTDPDGIARVWAVIRPPAYATGTSQKPIMELPSIDLLPESGKRFTGTYDGFSISGTYQVIVYARDRKGDTASPVLTEISINQPLFRRAVIVAGYPQIGVLPREMEDAAKSAYNALVYQGYTDETIYFMSPTAISTGVDGTPTLGNISHALSSWAETRTRDIVICLIGTGSNGGFVLNPTETLSTASLDTRLDALSPKIPGTITVICDFDYAGNFLNTSSSGRILIAGTPADRTALFGEGFSFSGFFFQSVLNGENLLDAFRSARNGVGFMSGAKADGLPLLDDTGNGIGNERTDGLFAMQTVLGAGIRLASADPQVGKVSPNIDLGNQSTAEIWISDISVMENVAKVRAIIAPPGTGTEGDTIGLPVIDLVYDAGADRYTKTYADFPMYGTYRVSIFAYDIDGNVSLAKEMSIFQPEGTDIYENDDFMEQAGIIVINDENPQYHNFHDAGDQDWTSFSGIIGKNYTFKVTLISARCEPVVELYDGSGQLIDSRSASAGQTELIWDWACPLDESYFIRLKNADSGIFGAETGYAFEIYPPIGPFVGYIKGFVRDAITWTVLSRVRVKTDAGASALSRPTGRFRIIQEPGSVTVTATTPGYLPASISPVLVGEGGSTLLDLALTPLLTDTDDDGIADDADNCLVSANPDQADTDQDGSGNACDECPFDPGKIWPGICGCGIPDVDLNRNGTIDCLETEKKDSDGDGTPDESDNCPDDPKKIEPGLCGCGIIDIDVDENGIIDCIQMPDSDGDGVTDDLDGCPEDPAKQAPGVCGCTNPDTDRDGDKTPDCQDNCPDDPKKTEPGKCGCGISETDCNPDAPRKPLLISPDIKAEKVSLTPVLTTGPFTGIPGRPHMATHWQIALSEDFSDPAMNIHTNLHLTTLPLPALLLEPETVYFWRVRFTDSQGKSSAWSDSRQFSTTTGSDADGNGIPDDRETKIPTDLDRNGETDASQPDLKCLRTDPGKLTVCGKTGAGNSITAMANHDSIPESENRPETMPLGLINLRIPVESPEEITLTLYFSKALPGKTRWFGYNLVNGWEMSVSDFEDGRSSITLTTADGGPGDLDGNG